MLVSLKCSSSPPSMFFIVRMQLPAMKIPMRCFPFSVRVRFVGTYLPLHCFAASSPKTSPSRNQKLSDPPRRLVKYTNSPDALREALLVSLSLFFWQPLPISNSSGAWYLTFAALSIHSNPTIPTSPLTNSPRSRIHGQPDEKSRSNLAFDPS